MGRILYSDNIEFDMTPWQSRELLKVAASSNCMMALTAGGEVLTRCGDGEEEWSARPSFFKSLFARLAGSLPEQWQGVSDLAVSGSAGVAVGLLKNGSCVMERVNTGFSSVREDLFRKAREEVLSWKSIRSVFVTDAIFALDAFGRVHCARLGGFDGDYRECADWRNVVRLVPVSHRAVFGITSDGLVLWSGGAVTEKQKSALEKLRTAAHLGVCGREGAEQVLVVHKDQRVEDLLQKQTLPFTSDPAKSCVISHRDGVALTDGDGVLRCVFSEHLPHKPFGDLPVASFAFGDASYGPAFLIGVTRES